MNFSIAFLEQIFCQRKEYVFTNVLTNLLLKKRVCFLQRWKSLINFLSWKKSIVFYKCENLYRIFWYEKKVFFTNVLTNLLLEKSVCFLQMWKSLQNFLTWRKKVFFYKCLNNSFVREKSLFLTSVKIFGWFSGVKKENIFFTNVWTNLF